MVMAEWKRSINMCDAHVCGSIAMYSTEMTVKNKVKFNRIRFAMRQTCVCEMVNGMRYVSSPRESSHSLKSEMIR